MLVITLILKNSRVASIGLIFKVTSMSHSRSVFSSTHTRTYGSYSYTTSSALSNEILGTIYTVKNNKFNICFNVLLTVMIKNVNSSILDVNIYIRIIQTDIKVFFFFKNTVFKYGNVKVEGTIRVLPELTYTYRVVVWGQSVYCQSYCDIHRYSDRRSRESVVVL